jgi:ribonucleoside-diphosphate reductase alpha chain
MMMRDMGFPCEDDVTKPDHTAIFSFPMKSPKNAIFRSDMTAIEQLELWKVYQDHWCEHKPSVTISVREEEWLRVGSWCYDNFDYMSGVSFLPFSDHIYRQAPYQDCSKEEYEIMSDQMPSEVSWDLLKNYEFSDTTTASQELNCTAGGCEIL